MPQPISPIASQEIAIQKVNLDDLDIQVMSEKEKNGDSTSYESPIDEDDLKNEVFNTNKDIVEKIIESSDDPDLNPWTARSVFLGVGLAIFGGVLQCIFYFKPQTILVNGIFLMLIGYTLGNGLSKLIPRKGPVGRFLNPFPFNKKEHVLITIMASSAATCALAIEVLAVQRLWYNADLNGGISIFIVFSSQLMGYGLCGLLRKALLYPTDMFYPNIIAQVSTIHSLHDVKNAKQTKDQIKWFYIVFTVFFLFEIIPEYIYVMLVGVSVPCLAAPNSPFVSRLFGGTDGNEGLGLFSFCFDWNYIASTANPMTTPIVATFNNIAGYFLCIAVFIGVYYGNVWKAKNFPFLSQDLFYEDSSPGNYLIYNQTLILDKNNHLDVAALKEQGVPYMTPTYVIYLIGTNLSVGATFTHMYLFHSKELAPAFQWLIHFKETVLSIKSKLKFWKPAEFDTRLNEDGSIPELYDDSHFRAMLKYKEVPQWWYAACLLLSIMVALICTYKGHTGLPWWMLFVAVILAYILTLMLGGLVAIFGFGGTQMQTVVQLIGSYMHPGDPLCNMYFTLYGYNSVSQAFIMLQDLKQGQYMKLSPRSTFAAQLIGTLIGAIFNYIMMQSIVDSKRDILLSIEGTAIWSGQNVQQYNTQGIAWGALAKYMFSIGKTYEIVPLALVIGLGCPIPFYLLHRLRPKWGINHINIPIFIWYMGWLCVGVNSSITTYFIVAIVSQFYLRKYKPHFFKKYNYIISAAMTGGAQVMVFILSFTVAGAGGENTNNPFPNWWGNYTEDPDGNSANYDHCMYTND